ncbi:MAG TPA: Uma2 family endonuclease [Thermoanaerobaculia bacterium]|nr:Uma2 family endonuclease [Thermoanaerobaculia bacterium]
MALAEQLLPLEAEYDLRPGFAGPVPAEQFERWPQEPARPFELVEGWVVPMSPGTVPTGAALVSLISVLAPLAQKRGWQLLADARHRLPAPPQTVLFPDLALHCTGEGLTTSAEGTALRPPELVIELLSPETAERDRGPFGAKFLAYQMSGVREYFYGLPGGDEAAGFVLDSGVYRRLEPDAEGYFPSQVLAAALRLAPAGLR